MFRSNLLFLAAAALSLLACVQLNKTGSRATHDAAADAAVDASDSSPDATPDEVAQDRGSPADIPPPSDVMPTECAPQAIGCASDGRSTRACNDQGSWVLTGSCPDRTVCSGGLCLCSPGSCDEGPIVQTQTAGLVGDLAAGGRFLFLAVNGPAASIRRFDIEVQPSTETVVRMGEGALTNTNFALDSDPMGNLIWCSDVYSGGPRTGQVLYGDQLLDTGACTHLRRIGNLVYYKGDVLYRRTRDPGTAPETVTREAMDTFEIAGDHVYFIGELNQEAFLKRAPLAAVPGAEVETILSRPHATFFRVMADAAHAYLIADGQILRISEAPNAQPEVFWQEPGIEAWAMVQTDSHLYWTTTTRPASGATACIEAQVFRRAKTGGPVTVLSRAPEYCAGPLVVMGDHLYTAIWGGLSSAAPTKILRLRL